MNKNFSIGVIAIGILESLITIITMFRVFGASSQFGDGFSIGFGLIIAVIASIALVITGLLAMSGGKITKGTFQELASTSRGFAQSVASSVQSPQQPGQPGQQQWQQPQQGFGQPVPGQGFQQAPQQPQQGFQQAPQQSFQQGFQQAPQQAWQPQEQQQPQQPEQPTTEPGQE